MALAHINANLKKLGYTIKENVNKNGFSITPTLHQDHLFLLKDIQNNSNEIYQRVEEIEFTLRAIEKWAKLDAGKWQQLHSMFLVDYKKDSHKYEDIFDLIMWVKEMKLYCLAPTLREKENHREWMQQDRDTVINTLYFHDEPLVYLKRFITKN